MISTRSLDALPDIQGLRRLLQSLATLDAILQREWEDRYYSFNSRWAAGQAMGSMRNGSGDHWFALFLSAGAGIVGLAHEAPMFRHEDPWPGLFSNLPPAMLELKSEPAFETKNCTFCLWRLADETAWHRGDIEFTAGNDPDGSAELLRLLDGDPRSYAAFAADYFEVETPVEVIAEIYAHQPLTPRLIATLNPRITLADLEADLLEIDYPRT